MLGSNLSATYEVTMSIDTISSELSDWEDDAIQACCLNGSQVQVLDEKRGIQSIRFETRQKEGFSLSNRKDSIKPMMSRITEVGFEYEHKNSDGSSNSVKINIKGQKDKDIENSTSTNNENDTKAPEIDSRDRCDDNSSEQG